MSGPARRLFEAAQEEVVSDVGLFTDVTKSKVHFHFVRAGSINSKVHFDISITDI